MPDVSFDVIFFSLSSFFLKKRPFFRLARLAKLAGHNAKDGLTSHGFMGFGNESSDKNDPDENGAPTTSVAFGGGGSGGGGNGSKASAAMAAGRKWGNIVQVSIIGFYFLTKIGYGDSSTNIVLQIWLDQENICCRGD